MYPYTFSSIIFDLGWLSNNKDSTKEKSWDVIPPIVISPSWEYWCGLWGGSRILHINVDTAHSICGSKCKSINNRNITAILKARSGIQHKTSPFYLASGSLSLPAQLQHQDFNKSWFFWSIASSGAWQGKQKRKLPKATLSQPHLPIDLQDRTFMILSLYVVIGKEFIDWGNELCKSMWTMAGWLIIGIEIIAGFAVFLLMCCATCGISQGEKTK